MVNLQKMLRSLKEKVSPEQAALVVVDVQNDFCHEEGVMSRIGLDISMVQAMVPILKEFIKKARKVNLPIIFIQSVYNTDEEWFLSDVWLEQRDRQKKGLFTEIPMCIKGSYEWEFYDGIKPKENEIVVTTHRYSALLDTDLNIILRSKSIRSLIITGVATNVCVESTARHGFMKDYYIVFVKDCVAGYSKKLHEATLENIDTYFGQVVASQEIMDRWKSLGSNP